MKILSISMTPYGAVESLVLDCGKTLKILSISRKNLKRDIVKHCRLDSYEDVQMDLDLNFPDYV